MNSIPEGINQLFFLTALGLWIGGIVIIAAAAPIIFKILDSRDQAGALVGALLRTFNQVKVICIGTFLAASLTDYLMWQDDVTGTLAARYALLGTMIVMAASSAAITTPALHALSREVGSFDKVASSHARRRFGSIHRVNSTITTIEIFCGMTVFYSI